MICAVCIPLCATSHAQLDARRATKLREPDVTPSRCPACGSTDWATTDQQLGKYTIYNKKFLRWLERE
jgi:hypothetical protein